MRLLLILLGLLISPQIDAQQTSINFALNGKPSNSEIQDSLEKSQNPFAKFIGEWTLKEDTWIQNWGGTTDTLKIPRHHTTSSQINTENSLLSIIDGPPPNGHIFWSYNPDTKEVGHLSSFGTLRAGIGNGQFYGENNLKLKISFAGEAPGTYRRYKYEWISEDEYTLNSVQFDKNDQATGLFYQGNFIRINATESTEENLSPKKPFINKTNEYLTELSKDENFGLSISISKDQEVLLEKAFGYANREHQVPNEIDTKFNIASIGKLFTAVSILQLKEQGKIDLHQTIGNYMPEFPNQFIRDSVTTHQLLTHTSGLPLWFNQTFDRKPKFEYLELQDYLTLYEALKIDPSRIGNNHYSNVGFITLGFLIEAISKQSYTTYVKEHIFEPLEMEETNFWRLSQIIPKVAQGYVRPSNQNDWWKTNNHLNMGSNSAGGTFSSARDLIKFYNGLRNTKLITEESKLLMFSPKTETSYGEYGYGIAISKYNNKSIIGHLGGYYGARGELLWYKDSNYTVSILANSDQTDYIDISHFIKIELTGTAKEKEAYKNTLDFIKAENFQKAVSDQAIKALSKTGHFDEALLQIKGYYYYNIQAYDQARKIFYLNTLLFPESQSAMNDLKKMEQ